MKQREKHYDRRAPVDPIDDETREPFGVVAGSGADEAFQKAMRKAIAKGKESAVEGVKVADPNDIRLVKPLRGETLVLTQSVAATLV